MSGYSARWREVFGAVDPARTRADVDFLRRVLPLPDFVRVLDVPCGDGRHLRALAALGYRVTGVDNDPAVAPPTAASTPLAGMTSLRRRSGGCFSGWI